MLTTMQKKKRLKDYLNKLQTIINANEISMEGTGKIRKAPKQTIPHIPGVYVIRLKHSKECVWVGQSIDIHKRIWEQHRTGDESSDLQKVVLKQIANLKENEARHWIENNCMVRWIEIPNPRERSFCEHFFAALLEPKWMR